MTTFSTDINSLKEEGERIRSAGNLHRYHWVIIGLCLLLTFGVWLFARAQIQQKISLQFDRHAQQMVGIISERMRNYENVLWGGVATVNSQSSGLFYDEWERYASKLHLESRYPGINGMGVIFHVLPENADTFLKEQQEGRPDYSIFPETDVDEILPVAFIEPVSKNVEAVGLDMAHEAERYRTIQLARDAGTAQMTAPVTIKQGAGQVSGFLMFAPIYESNSEVGSEALRRKHFTGLVYAPFFAKNLIRDALGAETRLVGIQISDAGSILYDEHTSDVEGYDPDPLFTHTANVSLYGRHWEFDVRSKLGFETRYKDGQPILILIGGLIVDALLLLFFILFARSNRKAIEFTEKVTQGYEKKSNALARVNDELSMFAYHASHDIRSPLMSISSLTGFSKKYLDQGANEKVEVCLNHIDQTTQSLVKLIEDILELTTIKAGEDSFEKIDLSSILDSTLENLSPIEGFESIEITRDLRCSRQLMTKQVRLASIVSNFLSNAIKYHDREQQKPFIKILSKEEGDHFVLAVQDNGLGIPKAYRAKLFGMFQRFHPDVSTGTGLGLYLCKRNAEALGGGVNYADTGEGSCFSVSIPFKE